MVNFPASLDSLSNPGATTKRNDPGFELHSVISTLNDIAEAVETKLGTGASTPTTADDVLYVSGTGATAYGKKGMVKLGEASGTGASGVITFSSIPATYRELQLSIYGRGTAAAAGVGVLMTLNGNTTAADYDYEFLQAIGASAAAGESLGANAYITCGSVPAASSTANLHSVTKITIPEYANTGGWKAVLVLAAGLATLTTGNLNPQFIGGAFESTAAIATIALTLTSGNWTTTSRVTLWGVMA